MLNSNVMNSFINSNVMNSISFSKINKFLEITRGEQIKKRLALVVITI